MRKSLFLNEHTAYRFLLSEADEDQEDASTDSETSAGTSTDSADASSDTAEPPPDDSASTPEDTPPTDTAEPPPDDAPASDSAPKRKPSRFAITVEDTKENRLFLFNKFEKLTEEHVSLKNFIDTLSVKVITDDKRKSILNKLKDKIDLNMNLLASFTDDNLYITLDISDIFGLYKIYYSDIKNINTTLRTLVRSTEEDSSQKIVRKPKSK